jgi:hypothetical protein
MLFSFRVLRAVVDEIKADLSGLAPAVRGNVRLDVNSTLTVDFRPTLAALTETLTVTGEAPLIDEPVESGQHH